MVGSFRRWLTKTVHTCTSVPDTSLFLAFARPWIPTAMRIKATHTTISNARDSAATAAVSPAASSSYVHIPVAPRTSLYDAFFPQLLYLLHSNTQRFVAPTFSAQWGFAVTPSGTFVGQGLLVQDGEHNVPLAPGTRTTFSSFLQPLLGSS